MKYFAFGSNLLKSRLDNQHKNGEKIGNVTDEGLAILEKYELVFNKKSTIDQSGKANIVSKENSRVLGVIYDLSERQVKLLKKIEGGYQRKKVIVLHNSNSVDVYTYIAKNKSIEEGLFPTKEYMKFIIDGAKEHSFPKDYITTLMSQKTKG
jgi:hypothetical protein